MSANPSTTGTPSTKHYPSILPERLFSKPILTTSSINIEGLSADKENLLSMLCKENGTDILLIQETHRGETSRRPKINGMKLILERPHDQYGSAVFVRPDTEISSISSTCENDIEILTVELGSCTITSFYKPPAVAFAFEETSNFHSKPLKFVLGDFNCHSSAWRYAETDANGEALEHWAERMNLKLIHDPKQPASFYSGRWRRGYNPDNIFVSDRISHQATKTMEEPLPRTQHRPITCSVTAVIKPEHVPFKRRFNFKKANWNEWAKELDEEVTRLEPCPRSYDQFVMLVKRISRRHIPRGCRTEYIAGLDDGAKSALDNYRNMYNQDPFSEETIQAGEDVLQVISTARTERWSKLITGLDMKQSSRRAWKLIKNLNNDPSARAPDFSGVTPDQIAHRLLLNGKSSTRVGKTKLQRDINNENDVLNIPFSTDEIKQTIHQLKENKAAGLDEIRSEQIKHFGPLTIDWLTQMMNSCVSKVQIPKIWRKAKVVALLKPGKEPTDPGNFRPVSLLCHLFKVLERMVLNRISDIIEEKIIPEQAGFRPGKLCCGQTLNLTQYIEDGFERKQITGVVFVDLSAAYDTVNHQRLVSKFYDITKDFRLTKLVECFLQNRRFFVTLQSKNSRWRNQRNGLPQGSVLAPILYNIYTNDQPINGETKRFIYADDTAIAAQGRTFNDIEDNLTRALGDLAAYYKNNHLKANPTKTQVCAFHLRNKEAHRRLRVTWQGQELEHNNTPKYLGIRLDRTLSFRKHCQEVKGKVCARNNIIRKLRNTKWGAQPHTLRTSALALCFSAAEYAAPVWFNSAHTKHVDVALNETVRMVSGCLKPTPVEEIYPIVGIAPPTIRRCVAARAERKKQETDRRHPLYGHQMQPRRLKSRKSFMRSTTPLETTPEAHRTNLWRMAVTRTRIEASEELAPGHHLPYPTWRTLNRLRTGVTRCNSNLKKWGYKEDDNCECGATQDHQHLTACPNMSETCTEEDLILANDKATYVADFWKLKI